MPPRKANRLAVPLCVALLGPGAALAGSLGVGPTVLELNAQKPVVVLNVRNTGDANSIVQLEILAWNQTDGSDQYQPTEEIAATPEVFELAPGAQREVRVGVRAASMPAGEHSYRVYVREVPPDTATEASQLNFAVRIGVPVFVNRGPRAEESRMSWELRPGEGGCAQLALRNDSPSRQRITHLELRSATGSLWESAAPVYVLAGATRLLQSSLCNSPDSAQALRITGETRTVELAASH
jgi:fimbrial chaperone protein